MRCQRLDCHLKQVKCKKWSINFNIEDTVKMGSFPCDPKEHLSRARKCPFLVMHELPSYNSDVSINLRTSVSLCFCVCVNVFFPPGRRGRRCHNALSAGYHQPETWHEHWTWKPCVYFVSLPKHHKNGFIDHQNENGGRKRVHTTQSNENEPKQTTNETQEMKQKIYIRKKCIFQINDLSSWLTRIVQRFGR